MSSPCSDEERTLVAIASSPPVRAGAQLSPPTCPGHRPAGMRGAVARILPRPVLPPIWRELTAVARVGARAATARAPAPREAGEPAPVLLIPGFLAGDATMADLATQLSASGQTPHRAGIAWNVDCSEITVARLLERADALAERYGRRLCVVGHSRGGLFARALAVRRPDLVAGVVTLGSPYRDALAIHPLLWAQAAALATLGTFGVPGLLRWSCAMEGCCEAFGRDVAAPMPAGVELLSVYTRADGVVDWRACADPRGRELEVFTTHCGMLSHPPTAYAVVRATEAFAEASPRPQTLAPAA